MYLMFQFPGPTRLSLCRLSMLENLVSVVAECCRISEGKKAVCLHLSAHHIQMYLFASNDASVVLCTNDYIYIHVYLGVNKSIAVMSKSRIHNIKGCLSVNGFENSSLCKVYRKWNLLIFFQMCFIT